MRSAIRGTALVLLVLLGLAGPASAQFEAGKKFFGPRIGLSGVGSAPAIGAAFEVAREGQIGIGGFVDYWSYSSRIGGFRSSVSYLAFGATGSYHFEVDDDRWDPFVGLALGYYVVGYEDNVSGVAGATGSRIFLGGQGGVRYFFKETMAVVARAGFGASYLSVGLDFVF